MTTRPDIQTGAGGTGRPADWGYRFIMAGLWLVALWLLALPWSTQVQETALNRYHLQTHSFLAWALQAPVPAMYNFHNRFRIEWSNEGEGREPSTGTLNHFPVRLLTFGESRGSLLGSRSPMTSLVLESSYRGQSITTRWRAESRAGGGFLLIDERVP